MSMILFYLLTRAGVYETLCPQYMLAYKENIYRTFPNINQVLFTFDTICMPNIMILAQGVLKVLLLLYGLNA